MIFDYVIAKTKRVQFFESQCIYKRATLVSEAPSHSRMSKKTYGAWKAGKMEEEKVRCMLSWLRSEEAVTWPAYSWFVVGLCGL